METLEAILDAGFLDGGGPANLDQGLDGACGGLGDVTAISNCIGGTLPAATLSERFFYAPVVTGSNVTNFARLSIWAGSDGKPRVTLFHYLQSLWTLSWWSSTTR